MVEVELPVRIALVTKRGEQLAHWPEDLKPLQIAFGQLGPPLLGRRARWHSHGQAPHTGDAKPKPSVNLVTTGATSARVAP